MASKKISTTIMRSKFLQQIPILLNDAVIETSQYGNNEVVSVFTPTKLAEKFRIEVMYACAANKNGTLPIINAKFYSPGFNVYLNPDTAHKILKMCYEAQHTK